MLGNHVCYSKVASRLVTAGQPASRRRGRRGTQWFQMSKIRQNISSPKVISQVFPSKYLQIHILSVSGCLLFTFKICQIVAGTISRIFESHFLRVFTVVPNVKNPPKHKFSQSDFKSFSMEISANSHNFRFQMPVLHVQNLANCYRHKYNSAVEQQR